LISQTSSVFIDKPVKTSQVFVLVPEYNCSRVTSKELLGSTELASASSVATDDLRDYEPP